MDPEGSLSCSQQPVTGPYPEPDESNPYLSTLFLWLIFQTSYSFSVVQVVPKNPPTSEALCKIS
jgi:hypothetical protein